MVWLGTVLYLSLSAVPTLKIAFVGDVMMARGVQRYCQAKKSFKAPFVKVQPLLQKADLLFGNLESPISARGKPVKKEILFRADPKAVYGLLFAGFDVMSLANNHALDYGQDALFDTRFILWMNGIKYVGAGKNLTDSRKMIVFETNGIKVGFIGCALTWPKSFYATAKKGGISPLNLKYLISDILKYRRYVDILVLSVHWGFEYEVYPRKFQIKLAHQLADAGVDIIVGHHPHVLQGLEFYKSSVIAYSLGNFVFDQPFPETKESVILWIDATKNGIKTVSITPLYLTNDGFFPVVPDKKKALSIYNRFLKISKPLNGGTFPDVKLFIPKADTI